MVRLSTMKTCKLYRVSVIAYHSTLLEFCAERNKQTYLRWNSIRHHSIWPSSKPAGSKNRCEFHVVAWCVWKLGDVQVSFEEIVSFYKKFRRHWHHQKLCPRCDRFKSWFLLSVTVERSISRRWIMLQQLTYLLVENSRFVPQEKPSKEEDRLCLGLNSPF